jgi:hypothetical protein
MADTTTTTYGFTKPEDGASEDTWGDKLNGNWDDVDDCLDGTTEIAPVINGGTFIETSETVYPLTGTALDPANGSVQYKTLSGNVTFTDSLTTGQFVMLRLVAGASYTVTWATTTWVTSAGDVAPTLTAEDAVLFWKEGSTLYGAYLGSAASA